MFRSSYRRMSDDFVKFDNDIRVQMGKSSMHKEVVFRDLCLMRSLLNIDHILVNIFHLRCSNNRLFYYLRCTYNRLFYR